MPKSSLDVREVQLQTNWLVKLAGTMSVCASVCLRVSLLCFVVQLASFPCTTPGTKKDAGTAIRASKLSPVGLLRVQDGLILLALSNFWWSTECFTAKLASASKLAASDFRWSTVCFTMEEIVQKLLKHLVLHAWSTACFTNNQRLQVFTHEIVNIFRSIGLWSSWCFTRNQRTQVFWPKIQAGDNFLSWWRPPCRN